MAGALEPLLYSQRVHVVRESGHSRPVIRHNIARSCYARTVFCFANH